MSATNDPLATSAPVNYDTTDGFLPSKSIAILLGIPEVFVVTNPEKAWCEGLQLDKDGNAVLPVYPLATIQRFLGSREGQKCLDNFLYCQENRKSCRNGSLVSGVAKEALDGVKNGYGQAARVDKNCERVFHADAVTAAGIQSLVYVEFDWAGGCYSPIRSGFVIAKNDLPAYREALREIAEEKRKGQAKMDRGTYAYRPDFYELDGLDLVEIENGLFYDRNELRKCSDNLIVDLDSDSASYAMKVYSESGLLLGDVRVFVGSGEQHPHEIIGNYERIVGHISCGALPKFKLDFGESQQLYYEGDDCWMEDVSLYLFDDFGELHRSTLFTKRNGEAGNVDYANESMEFFSLDDFNSHQAFFGGAQISKKIEADSCSRILTSNEI